MTTYVQVGDTWLNTAQVRAVRFEHRKDGTPACHVEFGPDHVLTFEGDDVRAVRGYLQYHMTTHPGPTTMPT